MEVRGSGFQPRNVPAPAPAGSDIRGSQVNALAGLSRKLTPDLVIGMLAGYERFESQSDSLTARVTADGWTIGGYAGWRLLPNLRIDGGVSRSDVAYGVTAGTATGSISGVRWLAMAGLTGQTAWQMLTIEPSARIHVMWERDDS